MDQTLIPVVATNHPLAQLNRSLSRDDLDAHVQLVLSDPGDVNGPSYGVISSRVWRFVDLARRLDFLLAGFGWCKMPAYLVEPEIAVGRLKALDFSSGDLQTGSLTVYAAHIRNQPLGRAGSWLLDDLQRRLVTETRKQR